MHSEIDLLNELLENDFMYIVLERQASNPFALGLTAFRDFPFVSSLYRGKYEDKYGLGAELNFNLTRELVPGEPISITDLMTAEEPEEPFSEDVQVVLDGDAVAEVMDNSESPGHKGVYHG